MEPIEDPTQLSCSSSRPHRNLKSAKSCDDRVRQAIRTPCGLRVSRVSFLPPYHLCKVNTCGRNLPFRFGSILPLRDPATKFDCPPPTHMSHNRSDSNPPSRASEPRRPRPNTRFGRQNFPCDHQWRPSTGDHPRSRFRHVRGFLLFVPSYSHLHSY